VEARKEFISGNEAVAIGAMLARPQVVSAYPISPQTIVVEKLAEYVESGLMKNCSYIRVESEHSALAAVLGAVATGARTFTATSSHGLMYMAEVLPFVSGSRFPVVMMNANRALAVPWSIFTDQSDSMMLLNSGWLQVYVEDAQEALDMVIQSYRIAEDPAVMSPIMINLDGFVLTHTYELVDIPAQAQVDKYLPPYKTGNKMSIDQPLGVCIGITPDLNTEFRYRQHVDQLRNAPGVIAGADREFGEVFGRSYGSQGGGLSEKYRCEDAEVVLVTLGSISMTARTVVDKLRDAGRKVGLFKIRFMRPFPMQDLLSLGDQVKVLGVLDKNISPGYEGTVFSQVNSALSRKANPPRTMNYVGGLAGREITTRSLEKIFSEMLGMIRDGKAELPPDPNGRVKFINMRWEDHE
jgi:pyruvate ferredoxin oxidoreductase alpha subunit